MQQAGKRIAPKIFYTSGTTEKVLTHDEIKKSKPFFNAALVGTVMKGLELELTEELPNVPIYFENTVIYDDETATKVIGPYYLKEKPEYNADSKTYSHILYDHFVLGMIEYKSIDVSYPTTIINFFKKLCEDRGLTTNITSLPNGNRIMAYDKYKGTGYTYRDVFTDIGQATATLFKINENNIEKCNLNNSSIVIDDDILKNKNIILGEHFGPINSVILSRSADSDSIYKRNESLKKWNEFKISDNILMNDNDRVDYLDEIYSALYGVEYDIFNLELVGYGGFEPLQKIEITTNNKTYESYVFNNEEIFTQGYEENIYADLPEETNQDYSISDTTDRRIKETYLIVSKQNQKIEAAVNNSENALSQTTNLTIELGKIQGIVSEKADTTTSAENIGKVKLENINKSEVIMLQIHPTSEDITSTYTSKKVYLSKTFFFASRKVVFENKTGYKIKYRLPADLRVLDDVYDEFTLNLNNRICTVTKRIDIDSNGDKYVLSQPKTETYEYPSLNLEEGDYTVYMPSYKTANIFCRLMTKNAYTEQFAVKVEVESMFEQLKDQITLQVNKKLEDYSTTTEMNSAIVMKANEINNSVNLKIKNVNGNIKDINATLSLKVDEKNLISIINAKADVIKLEGNRFSWTSSNSSLSEDGTLKAKNVDISGKITATSGTFFGKITATSGKIGGFVIGTNNITNTTENCWVAISNATNSNKDFLVVRTGTSEANYAYPFWVRGDGTFHAEKADITGKITATSGSFTGRVTANSGKIADWSITEGKIYAGDSTTGVAVVQRPARNMNWVFAAGGKSHDSYADCPFRVSKAGKLYATGVEISGKITATSGSISGSLVTSGINANNLSSGSVTSCNIDIYNGTGFLRMLNGSAYHPFVSALNVARGSGGVVFRSSGDRTNTGNNIGQIYADANVIYISAENGTNIANYLKCGNIGISGNKVRGNSDTEITLNYSVVLKPNPNGGAYIWGTEDYNKILTSGGSPSTLSVKEFVKEKDTSDIPGILKLIKLYDYKYIQKIENGKEDYGYIIDYLEEIPNIKNYLNFYNSERNGIKFKQLAHEQISKFLLGAVVELQKQIEELKERR